MSRVQVGACVSVIPWKILSAGHFLAFCVHLVVDVRVKV